MRKLRLVKPWQLTTVRQPLSFERNAVPSETISSYQPCMGPRGTEDRTAGAQPEAVRCQGPRGTEFDRFATCAFRR